MLFRYITLIAILCCSSLVEFIDADKSDKDNSEDSDEPNSRSKCRCISAWMAQTSDVISPLELAHGRLYTRPRRVDRFASQPQRFPVLEPFIEYFTDTDSDEGEPEKQPVENKPQGRTLHHEFEEHTLVPPPRKYKNKRKSLYRTRPTTKKPIETMTTTKPIVHPHESDELSKLGQSKSEESQEVEKDRKRSVSKSKSTRSDKHALDEHKENQANNIVSNNNHSGDHGASGDSAQGRAKFKMESDALLKQHEVVAILPSKEPENATTSADIKSRGNFTEPEPVPTPSGKKDMNSGQFSNQLETIQTVTMNPNTDKEKSKNTHTGSFVKIKVSNARTSTPTVKSEADLSLSESVKKEVLNSFHTHLETTAKNFDSKEKSSNIHTSSFLPTDDTLEQETVTSLLDLENQQLINIGAGSFLKRVEVGTTTTMTSEGEGETELPPPPPPMIQNDQDPIHRAKHKEDMLHSVNEAASSYNNGGTKNLNDLRIMNGRRKRRRKKRSLRWMKINTRRGKLRSRK